MYKASFKHCSTAVGFWRPGLHACFYYSYSSARSLGCVLTSLPCAYTHECGKNILSWGPGNGHCDTGCSPPGNPSLIFLVSLSSLHCWKPPALRCLQLLISDSQLCHTYLLATAQEEDASGSSAFWASSTMKVACCTSRCCTDGATLADRAHLSH